MLSGKKVLLGVTGGIAAYKSTFLVRLLIKAGAEVQVILSPAARDFVSPLTLATLSKNPVLWEYFDSDDPEEGWHNHVELGLWADLILIAPATANTLSKMAHARADNLLLGCYLSAKCPVFFAPAMDLDMYKHPANRENLDRLQQFGNRMIPAESGELASGLEGEGRLAEPEHILAFIQQDLKKGLKLAGKKVLITAGPTYEAIDPVRFIGNHSSGKMGIALAEAAHALGAEVQLILGPSSYSPTEPTIKVTRVRTAQEMLSVGKEYFPGSDLAIFSAAVSDYRPAEVAEQKIKKQGGGANRTIELVENPDILATLAAEKRPGQRVVGFALETENALENARKKLHTKNCDLIVLNQPDQKARGFGHDTNEVTLVEAEGETPLSLKSKQKLAYEILDHLIDRSRSK